jgi:hypothetical protein
MLLTACIIGFLGLRAAASRLVWQDQHDNAEVSHVSKETSLEQQFPYRPTMPRTTYSRSCIIDSFANIPSFILREYQIEAVVGLRNTTQLRGTFSVENPGSGDTYRLYHIPVSVGGGVWSVCRAGEDAPLPPQLVICQYLLERRSGRIGFRFQWYACAWSCQASKWLLAISNAYSIDICNRKPVFAGPTDRFSRVLPSDEEARISLTNE